MSDTTASTDAAAVPNPFATPGAISWTELATTDPAAAAAFYASLFGWEVESVPMPMGPYFLLRAAGHLVGGITGLADPAQPPQWSSYVTVPDADAMCAKVRASGGKILQEPFTVPTVGRMFLFEDPQGARINAITYEAPQG
jgi:hypothetical protein